MNSRVNAILIILISLASLLIFVLPFGWVYLVDEENNYASWKEVYLIEDWLSLAFYLPFVILWIIYLIRINVLNSVIFRILLVLAAFITFAISFLSCTVIAQDYESGWGVLTSLLVLPLLVIFLMNNRVKNSD